MVNFIRTKSSKWDTVDQSQYLESIVFIEDTKQLWSNNVKYLNNGNNLVGFERVEFSNSSISMEPNKFYFCNEPLNELDITLLGEGVNDYFVEFICNDTCIILPSNIKWENEIIPDFTKSDCIMTLKIQDDTIYLIDCRSVYYVSYSALRRTQPNRNDAFGSNIIAVTDNMFILDGPATEIKEGAFEGNDDLISIEIPSTVKKIGSQAFSNCSNLETISYQGDLSDWNKIEISDNWKENTNTDVNYYISYLTFTALEDGEIGFYVNPISSIQPTIEYSYNKQNWNTLTEEYISVPSGSNIYCRGINPCGISPGFDEWIQNYFISTGQFNVSGDIMSLIDYKHSVKEMIGTMMYMFGRNEDDYVDIVDASNLILSAETLISDCYQNMFDSCVNMVYPPQIKAATLAPYCCKTMFYNCHSLIESPSLLATVLDYNCYQSMFAYTQAIPDTSNIDFYDSSTWNGGLHELFAHTNITDSDLMNILPINPETDHYWLPATTLADHCYDCMFYDCTSLVTAPELPATRLDDWCYSNMFTGCTSLTTAPELPATMLTESCYSHMFQDCTNLNYIKCLATDISANGCTSNWLNGVASTGIFIKHPDMNDWSGGSSGIPTGWTVEDDSPYKTVDLDLPSGRLWSDRNIGATSPEDNGLYFQWGDTEGYSSNQVGVDKIFDWNNYKWCEGNYNTLTKYNSDSSYGIVDNKTVLDLEDDTAYVNMGSKWKIPTLEDNKELIDNTDQIFEDVNGNRYWVSTNIGNNIDSLPILNKDSIADVELNGVYFLSRTNGNSIFLPASGYCNGANLIKTDLCGRYWSSNICENNLVYPLYFGGINLYPDDYCNRSFGFCIRAIKS